MLKSVCCGLLIQSWLRAYNKDQCTCCWVFHWTCSERLRLVHVLRPIRSSPNEAWELFTQWPWAHIPYVQCPSIGGLLNTFYQGPSLSDVFFWGGGGSFVPSRSSPCTWQPIWGPWGRSLDAPLTDPPVLDRSDDERLRGKREEEGGEDEERARGESEEWREGEHRGAVLQILRGRASHNVGLSPLSSSASSLLHLHCSVTQD